MGKSDHTCWETRLASKMATSASGSGVGGVGGGAGAEGATSRELEKKVRMSLPLGLGLNLRGTRSENYIRVGQQVHTHFDSGGGLPGSCLKIVSGFVSTLTNFSLLLILLPRPPAVAGGDDSLP